MFDQCPSAIQPLLSIDAVGTLFLVPFVVAFIFLLKKKQCHCFGTFIVTSLKLLFLLAAANVNVWLSDVEYVYCVVSEILRIGDPKLENKSLDFVWGIFCPRFQKNYK